MLEQYISNLYLRTLTILAIAFILIRTFVELFERIALKITSKTKTEIDDKLIHRLSMPFTVLSFLVSIQIAIAYLEISEKLNPIINSTGYSLIAIVVAYIVYVTMDVVVIHLLKKAMLKTKTTLDDSVVSLFHSVMYISLIIISLIYILNLWGVEIGPLLAGLGIAGLAVALALQPVLSNIFSGASIILDRTVRVGDRVLINKDTIGTIQKIGIRSTKIITNNNELVIMPNSKVADSVIQNLALPEPKTRLVITFSVAYGSNIEKVKRIVLKELKSSKYALKIPEPEVLFSEMGDSSLKFKAYFYVESFQSRLFDGAMDELNTRIYNALNENGIEIPLPQMDVHLKK